MKSKTLKIVSFFLVSIFFFSCASTSVKNQTKTNDLIVQVINMSSHDIQLWPEITLGNDGVPIKYDEVFLSKGDAISFYYNSDDIIADFKNWMVEKNKKYDMNYVWFICGYRQCDTDLEHWTTGRNLVNLKNLNQTLFIVDTMEDRKGIWSDNLSEAVDNVDCNYTPWVNNSMGFAFGYCNNLASVEIGDGVQTIGQGAFADCDSLTNIEIGDRVQTIGQSAFADCSNLTSVVIGTGVKTIVIAAFAGCSSLTSLTLSNSLTTIGYKAFYGCVGLTSLTIPKSVTWIGFGAFGGCTNGCSFYCCYCC